MTTPHIPQPCRSKGEVDERPAHPDNYEEPCVCRKNCRSRDAGLIHTPRMIHRRRMEGHRTMALRREDVYPRNE